MKCLCWDQSFANQQSLKNHYVEFHNVDENNHLFRKLFTRDNFFVPRKCFHCDYFCIDRRDEKNHNFLTHYQLGSKQPIEDKSLKKHSLMKIKKVLYKFFRAWNLFIIFTFLEKQCQNIWRFFKIIIHLMQTLYNLGLNVLLQL